MAKIEKEFALTFDDVLLKPMYSEISSRRDADTSCKLFDNVKLSIPIVSANMDTVTDITMARVMAREGGVGVIHRFMSVPEQVTQVKTLRDEGLVVGAAVGVSLSEDVQRVADLILTADVSFIVLDIAHAHSKNVKLFVDKLKDLGSFDKVPFVGGNVATREGAKFLIDCGFRSVKVGIGAGSICTTRTVTGFGVSQLSAIMDCAAVCHENNVSLIADGGIRTSGDIVKALAAGADAVMLGSSLAGTDEAPGRTITRNGTLWKHVRGMASVSANVSRRAITGVVTEEYVANITPEGVEATVPYRGSVRGILTKMVGGLKSGLSYAGAHSIQELQEKAVFVPITNAGLKESHTHDVVL